MRVESLDPCVAQCGASLSCGALDELTDSDSEPWADLHCLESSRQRPSPTENPHDAHGAHILTASSLVSCSTSMDGKKAQQRTDLEKGGLRVSESALVSATQPLGPTRNLASAPRTERLRSRVRRLLVFLAISGFVFHATTRVFKQSLHEDGASFRGRSHMFVHIGEAEHGLYGKKAEELFLFVSTPL